MADEIKDQRIITLMTPSEVEAIDEWMFENRIRSRGEAIRRLCQIGLTTSRSAEDTRDSLMAVLNRWIEVTEIVKSRRDARLEDDLAPFASALSTYSIGALPVALSTIALMTGRDFDTAMELTNGVWTSTGDLVAEISRGAKKKPEDD